MAILYTPNRHIPYPDGDQLPAGNLQLQAIAERLDDDWHKGTNAARLAAPAPSANTAGRRWFETDTGDYYVDIATAWAKVGSVNTVTQANIDASIADHADNYGLGAHIPPTGVTSAMIADGTVGIGDLAFDPATQAELDAEAAARVAADATKQGLNANLTALSGLAGVADRLPYFTGAGALALATFTAAGRAIVARANGIVNADVDAAAAIVYSKLALADSVKYTDAAKDANGHAAGSFRAYNNTGNAYASGSLVPMPTEDYDVSNWFDPATGRFTPQVRGIYEIKAQLALLAIGTAAAPQWEQMAIARNGAVYAWGGVFWDHGAGGSPTVVAQVLMNGTTDYVQPYLAHNHGSAVGLISGGTPMNYFEGHMIGRTS